MSHKSLVLYNYPQTVYSKFAVGLWHVVNISVIRNWCNQHKPVCCCVINHLQTNTQRTSIHCQCNVHCSWTDTVVVHKMYTSAWCYTVSHLVTDTTTIKLPQTADKQVTDRTSLECSWCMQSVSQRWPRGLHLAVSVIHLSRQMSAQLQHGHCNTFETDLWYIQSTFL